MTLYYIFMQILAGKDEKALELGGLWSMPFKTVLNLRDNTGFRHTRGWTVLQFVEAVRSLLLSCTNTFTVTKQISHLLLKFPSPQHCTLLRAATS